MRSLTTARWKTALLGIARRWRGRLAVASLVLLGCSGDDPSAPAPQPNTPPANTASIEMTSPPRGGMVQAGTVADYLITLRGVACDSVSTVASVSIDGQPVSLTGTPPCLDFTAEANSRWGMNLITGTARNQAGATTTIAQSYLRSPGYFAPLAAPPPRQTAAAEKVPGGVYMQLNQAFVDDDNRADVDDIATLLQRKIAPLNYNGNFTNPIWIVGDANRDGQVDALNCDCLFPIPDIVGRQLGYRVVVGAITGGSLRIDRVQVVDGGFDAEIDIASISVPISVTGYGGPGCEVLCVTRFGLTGTATGTATVDAIRIVARIGVSLGGAGHPQVTICPTCVQISAVNVHVDINWGVLEFLDDIFGLSNITSAIVNVVKGEIEGMLADQVVAQLPAAISGLLEGFELSPTVTLPAPMNTVLNIESDFDRIEFTAGGSARLGLAVGVTPASPEVASPLGSIQRGGDVPAFDATPYALGVAFKDDFVNQFMWAAWRGGAFEIDAVSGTGCDVPGGQNARISLVLPPVVMPGTGGHPITIGIGDLYIEATSSGATTAAAGSAAAGEIALYASMIAGAEIGMDPATDQLALTLAAGPRVTVQIVHAPEGADLGALTSQYSAFAECVLSRLLVQVVQSIPIPSPPIGRLGLQGVPASARWVLNDGTLNRQDPYTAITGNVIVR